MTTYCTLCEDPICEADFIENRVADHHIYDCDRLLYIELAHMSCAEVCNEQHSTDYWAWTPTFVLNI